ncbi:MAG: chemotaxis protein CheZ, partial [Rhodospirillaceae bacterium]|nr:chemotaxis protein CheZ [Rhodospirillaceae bacterium]
MDTEEVSAGIEQLVDHLRVNKPAVVNLGDIASVTEILLAAMRSYFNSIDTTLYSEFRGLSEYIQRARTEISELRPNDLKQDKIPRAGLELEAIVASTETATGTIMDSAEEIMSADPTADDYAEKVNEACMNIFEACSFQDITGQRITKVVATLTYIEERLHGLQDAWGPDIADADGEAPDPIKNEDVRPDSDLLNGPA